MSVVHREKVAEESKESRNYGFNSQIVKYDPLVQYIKEIKKYSLLTKEKEHELSVRYWKYRDKEAAFILITSNLLLVVKLVMEFRTKQQNLLDLIQEGNIGLLEAIKRFDPYRGVRFSTYASWWIKAYILKYLLDNWRIVKIGTTNKKRKLFYNLKKEKARLESMGIYPGTKLLARNMGANEKEIIEMTQGIEQGDVSLESTYGCERESSLIDILPDGGDSAEEKAAEEQFQHLLNHKIEKFKQTLRERERVILEKRLLSERPATLQEIADRFRLTKEAIRYTEKKVIDKLKKFMTEEIPDIKLNLLSMKE